MVSSCINTLLTVPIIGSGRYHLNYFQNIVSFLKLYLLIESFLLFVIISLHLCHE